MKVIIYRRVFDISYLSINNVRYNVKLSIHLSMPFFRLEQFIKEMAMKGVAKEALISMIKDKGAELRSSDGVTALYETDARYFPTDSMVKNIVGRAIRAQRLHAHDQPACEAFVKREQELKPDDKWYFRASTPQQVGTDDQFGIHGSFADMQSLMHVSQFRISCLCIKPSSNSR
jgi:hypothetical protein